MIEFAVSLLLLIPCYIYTFGFEPVVAVSFFFSWFIMKGLIFYFIILTETFIRDIVVGFGKFYLFPSFLFFYTLFWVVFALPDLPLTYRWDFTLDGIIFTIFLYIFLTILI